LEGFSNDEFFEANKAFIGLFVINIGLLLMKPEIGGKSLQITGNSIMEMMSILPAIFILLG
jgi:hypothetical protein